MLSGFSSGRLVRAGTAPPTFEEIPADKEETLSYELTAVLFADGTFYGPDDILADFSKQIDTARSMARDTQYLEDKYTALEQQMFLKAMRRVNATTDIQALLHRSGLRNAAHLGYPGGTGSRGGASKARRVARHSGDGLVYDLAGGNGLNLETLRARLQRMSERELLRLDRAARKLDSL